MTQDLPQASRHGRKRPLQPRGSPLHFAALLWLTCHCGFLVSQCPQDVHSRGFYDDTTPLHLASRRGHEDVSRLLLVHGADATARADGGKSPLHMASERGHEHVVRLLLEHGADATAQAEAADLAG
jgi:ankyrin repeat protein